jgi:hypothetical protein
MAEGRRPGRREALDVYLFPTVVGGGLGDIAEVLTVGRRLESDGHHVLLFRRPGRPLPRSVEGPWAWPRIERVDRPVRRSRWAMTISPTWGVCAAPERRGPLGRGGEWAEEAADVGRAYGRDSTVQVSIEEFARTLTSRQQTVERYREGGVPTRTIRRRLANGELEKDAYEFHRAYRRYRGFDVPNLLHVFATFSPSRSFRSEFPEAVQTGPIRYPRRRGFHLPHRPRATHWVAHATAPSSSRLLVPVARTLRREGSRIRLEVRGGPPAPGLDADGPLWTNLPELTQPRWERKFRSADLRIVTGSRTLIEALEHGGPFLYFNGAMGAGAATRRHRPEKIDRLMSVWREARVSRQLRRDLADVSRLRRVDEVVRRALSDSRWRASFPAGIPTRGFAPPFDRGEELIATVARSLPGRAAPDLVASVRAGQALERETSIKRPRVPVVSKL